MILTPHRKDYHTAANQGCLLSAIYAYGDVPPRYPVPATMNTAVLSLLHQPEVGQWAVQWAKRDLYARLKK